MGFFDFFKSKAKLAESPGGTAIPHQRFHARYRLNDPDLCTLEHARHGLFRVIDFSYHGCLLEAVGDASFEHCAYPGLVEIMVGGSSFHIEAGQCQKRKNGWGVVFKHTNESSIRGVGTFIEPLRYGSSAVALPSDPSRDGVMSKFRRRYQGDGPFDLVVEENEAGKIVFVMATIRRGNEYGCVVWEKGRVVTKKTIDSDGVGARMGQTQDVDRPMVWVSVLACLGLKFPDGPKCAAIFDVWLKDPVNMPVAKSS